jgi:NarL family two-component system response regulator LiaR
VVLMDLVMPEMDGVTAIGRIRQQQPRVRIIALSSFGEEQMVKSALGAGATSYLLKNTSADRLAKAIRSTSSGMPTFAPEIAPALLQAAPPPRDGFDLTPREREVLALMSRGLSNRQMSQRLVISAYTIKNHVSSILGKLGVTSRTEAVSLALRRRLVQTD